MHDGPSDSDVCMWLGMNVTSGDMFQNHRRCSRESVLIVCVMLLAHLYFLNAITHQSLQFGFRVMKIWWGYEVPSLGVIEKLFQMPLM